ncbi:hypothetical protein QJQ45_022902 [Haematococcus lacustris]|nr:hypothetical protein QJQ45_022902 [Haematococcus lacustris]
MFRRMAQLVASQLGRAAAAGSNTQVPVLQPHGLASTLSPVLSGAATSLPAWPLPLQWLAMRTRYTYAFKRSASVPGLIYWRPCTPGQRHKISIDYAALGVYTGPPAPELSFRKKSWGGRDWRGHLTVRGRGGGVKKVVRVVDYARCEQGERPGVVERVELDPNRTGFLAYVRYDSEDPAQPAVYRYHLAPDKVRIGDVLHSGPEAPIRPGSSLPLRNIPVGVEVHNIELEPGKGGVMARSAGTYATIQYKEEHSVIVRLPSSEVRRLHPDCRAVIGRVSNHMLRLTNAGKAGTNRLRGRRPKVRGYAMNPIDHPHGGRTNGGRPSCSPWGLYAKGRKTRRRNKWTNMFIIERAGGQPIAKFVQGKKKVAAAEVERKLKSGGAGLNKHATPPAALLGPPLPAWGTAIIRLPTDRSGMAKKVGAVSQ